MFTWAMIMLWQSLVRCTTSEGSTEESIVFVSNMQSWMQDPCQEWNHEVCERGACSSNIENIASNLFMLKREALQATDACVPARKKN